MMKLIGRFASFLNSHITLFLQILLLSAGCVFSVLRLLSFQADLRLIAAACLACMAVYAVLPRRMNGLYYPLALLAMTAAVLLRRNDAELFLSALRQAFSGDLSLFVPFADTFTVLLCIFCTSCALAVCQGTPLFFASALCILCAAGFTLTGKEAFPAMLPLMAALPLCACREDAGGVHAVLMSLCALLLAACFLPFSGTKVPEFEEKLRDAWDYIREHFFYTEARMPFSLAQLGWEPLGRPGGTVSPSDTPVFWANVGGPALLRGTVHSEYDGHSFSDPQPGERYSLDDLRFGSLRDTLFDRSLPQGRLVAALPAAEDITVHLISDSAGTLWLTERFDGLMAPDLTLYHSGTGEIFATRDLAADDVYQFRGIRLTSDTAGIRELAAAAEAAENARQETDSRFTALPDCVEPEIYALAQQITAGADTAYDKAAALCAWLRQSYPYSLQQNQPPDDRDFVSWFLLTEKRGCCTSFAAAMVVLARAASLPARFIEGFSVSPDADGIALATGKQAHAWAEVYLPGFGWLAFDATPADDPDSSHDSNSGAEALPTPSSSPTPAPTPTPSPEPDPQNGSTPTPEPEPSREPEPSDTPVPTPAPEPPEDSSHTLPPLLFLLPLILLLAVALRLWFTGPRFLLRRRNSGRTVLVAYRLCVQMLGCMGLAPRPDESPAAFLSRAEKALSGDPPLSAFADAVTRARYSGRKPTAGDAALARHTVGLLAHRLSIRQRAKWIFTRLFHRTVRLAD